MVTMTCRKKMLVVKRSSVALDGTVTTVEFTVEYS